MGTMPDLPAQRSEGGELPGKAAGLPMAAPAPIVALAGGECFDLRVAPVAQRIGGGLIPVLACNGSIPGPALRVRQGSEIAVRLASGSGSGATVACRGLRLENRSGGAPLQAQPTHPGAECCCRARFPDEGLYSYQAQIREDCGRDTELCGSIIVEPAGSGCWPPADREVILTVGDTLMNAARAAPHHRSGPVPATVGRPGDVLLVNGSDEWSVTAGCGEAVRFYLTNTAATRVFSLGIPGAVMKLVSGAGGRCEEEEETFRRQIVVAPRQRAIVDVLFDRAKTFALVHRSPGRADLMGRIHVRRSPEAGLPARPGPGSP